MEIIRNQGNRSRYAGLTFVELLVVCAIIVALAAILTPVLLGVRRKAKEALALSNLRQIWAAVSIYRTDYGGDGVYGGASAMGMLDLFRFYEGEYLLYSKDEAIWEPACGTHPQIEMEYPKIDYFPEETDRSGKWVTYVQEHQDSALLFRDRNCTDPSIPLNADFYPRTVLAVRLSGQASKKIVYGYASSFEIWD